MDKVNNCGETPLHSAYAPVRSRHFLGFDDDDDDIDFVSSDDDEGDYYVQPNARLDIGRYLLEQGANGDKANSNGATPLHLTAALGDLEMARLLIERGADKEAVDRDGNTPLLNAARQGHLKVVRLLLEQGADRDKANNQGDTPLHIVAGSWGFGNVGIEIEILKLLMVSDLNARNSRGQLPIDVARAEEMKQAIRDEPRRRLDHGYKRATEQDRHPNVAASANAQQEGEEEGEGEDVQSNKLPRLGEGEAEEGKIAEEDEDSEPSDEEDND